MLRLRDTQCPHTASFLAGAIRTAEFYGFVSIDSLPHARLEAPKRRDGDIAFVRRDERALLTAAKNCMACTRGANDILLLWRLNKLIGREQSSIPTYAIELHVIGASHAFAEALLIIVAHAIAVDAGVTDRVVSINSIGSMESSNRFVRDVSTFLRKHIDTIAPSLRPRAATDPLGTLVQLFERGHPATSRAPQSMEYLTEEERRRFWDLLEYLEVFGIPYELSHGVLGSRDLWSHTLYELALTDKETGTRIPFAFGGRYDPLATRITNIDTSAATISIMCEIRGKWQIKQENRPAPVLYFAHLGLEARRRAFSVLETLRRAGIPVRQSLMHEKLGDQMEHAKKTHISHLLLMGHKEAVEGTVLVREIATNAQEAVSVSQLPGYLRRQQMKVSIEPARVSRL